MLADQVERPTVAESYAGAISSGSSRMEAHRTKPADLIAAAGMSPYRMGTALMRLVSEWQSGAVPRPTAAPSERDLRKLGLGAEAAVAEARRLAAQRVDWHLHEVQLRFQRLKTLGTVRAGLLHWVRDRGWDDAEGLVAAVLQHFLSPKCPKCGGSGVIVVEGTGGRSAGKRCRADACRKSDIPGELLVPHQGRGRALLAYMRQCTGQAAHDMRDGTRKLRHYLKQDVDRFNQRERNRSDMSRRADAEAQADLQTDTAAIAERFRRTMR